MKKPSPAAGKASPILQFEPAELLYHINDAMIATDMNFNVVFFNKAAEDIYGISRHRILNKPLDPFIRYTYHGTTVKECLYDLFSDGYWQGKVSFQREDGNVINLLANMSFILGKNGNRNGVVTVNKNITELEKTAEKSVQYKRRMKAILDGTSEALFLVDRSYKILLLNNNARRFVKTFVDKEAEVGDSYLQLFPSWRQKPIRMAIAKALRGESTEYEVLYPNGRWALVNYRAVLNEYTDEKEICISARDISVRKKAEEEVKMLSLLAKETVNGVMITDTNSTILWVNTSFLKIYGYAAEEVVGHHPEFLFKGLETDPGTIQQIHEHVDAQEHFVCELVSYNRAGKKLWIRLDMHPILDQNRKLSKYLVMVTDLTEQRLQQQKEMSTRIAEQKKINRIILQTQEAFSNELGRELHDNVNQILTAAKLQIEVGETNIELGKEFLQKGRANIEEAIKEIRILSKQLTAPRFAEADLLQEIDSLIENMCLTNIVDLDTRQFDADLSPDMKLNLFRILQEQLKNIVKHAAASTVFVQLENDDKNITMCIEDNGNGFDLNKKKDGIGLSNIRSRVECYNGSLDIRSAPGKGCWMLLKFPIGKC